MNNTVYWDATSCILALIYRRIGETLTSEYGIPQNVIMLVRKWHKCNLRRHRKTPNTRLIHCYCATFS